MMVIAITMSTTLQVVETIAWTLLYFSLGVAIYHTGIVEGRREIIHELTRGQLIGHRQDFPDTTDIDA